MELTVNFLLQESAAGRARLSQPFLQELRSKPREAIVVLVPYEGKQYCFYVDSEEEARRLKSDVTNSVNEWYRIQNLENPFLSTK